MWARSALGQLAALSGVHRAGLALAEGGGRRLLFSATDRDNERRVEWCQVDVYEDVPLNHTVRTGEPVMGSRHDLAGSYRSFVDRQSSRTQAFASVPVSAAGQVQGGYVLFFETPQPFGRPQQAELVALGARLGAGLRRVQRATTHASRSLGVGPAPQGAATATYRVGADLRAVAEARHFALRTLAAWGVDEDTVGNATLCLSELVTNAIMHTDAGCELRLMLDRGVLTSTVRDGGSTVVVDPRHVKEDPLAVHGRGLQVVDSLSTRWGSELDAGGMTVWFVLEPTASVTGRAVPQLTSTS